MIGADDVARKEFATSFRGYDPHEVRAFLGHIGAELAELRANGRSLEDRLAAAESRAVPRELGGEELERALGLEMAKVLQASREAAADIRRRAEEQVARLLQEASEEIARLRAEAAADIAERSAEAESAAAVRRDEADRAAEEARAAAVASASAEVEAAKERGRQMVVEAQVVRERILRDLGRRRRLGQQHLEQLRAGRERLLEACRGVQGVLDVAMADLVVSEPEARAAAETAGLRVAASAELTLEELEAEVVAAVDAGLVAVPPRPQAEAAEAGVATEAGPEAPPAGTDPPTDAAAGPEAERGAAPRRRIPDPPAAAAVVHDQRTAGGAAPVAEEPVAQRAGQRRRRRSPAPATVQVVDAGERFEGVRLLPPEPPAVEPPAGEVVDPAAAGAGEAVDVVDEVLPGAAGTPVGEGAVVDAGPGSGEPGASAGPVAGEAAQVDLGADGGGAAQQEADHTISELPEDRAATVAGAGDPPTEQDAGGRPGPATVDVPAEVPVDDAAAAVTAAFDQRDGQVEPHERALARALKRALADEQNQLLDDLRQAKGVPGPDVLLPPAEEHAARCARVAVEVLAAAAASGGGSLPAAEVQAMATAMGADLVAGLRPRLARALDDGGGDEAAVAGAVSAAYREWKTARIEPLARHHVLSAWAAGSFASADDAELQWVVDPEVGCSPDCADNVLAGPTAKGEAFPTGQLHPPAHPGCRCLVLPANR